MRRILVVAAVGTLLSTVAAPARANLQDRLTVSPNQTVTREYPAIIGANPAPKQHNDDLNQPGDPDPATCSTVPTCDEIPLTVKHPAGLSVFDSFTFRVELRWEGTADLDLYLWYEPPGPTPTRRSITAAQPEVIVYPAGDTENYHLVVNNAAGLSQGYTVKVTSQYEHVDNPFDGAASPPSFNAAPSFTTPTFGVAPDTPSPGGTTAPAPPQAAIDPDLGNLSAAGPAPNIFRDTATGTRRAHEPVAGATVFLWAVVVPLLATIAAGAVLYRRRPRALSYRAEPTSRR